MERRARARIALNFDVLPRATRRAFDTLAERDWLKNPKWYLAGGTALALQVGHRRSLDLDFFTTQKRFDTSTVLRTFSKHEWQTNSVEPGTLFGALLGAKVSFISYPFFKPRLKPVQYGSISLLQPGDIAVMKLVALSQRGRKRDFYDLYWYAHNVEPLENVLRHLPAQFPDIGRNYHHVLKSMDFFADAEADAVPRVYFNVRWTDVKKFFRAESVRLVKAMYDV